MAWPDILLIQYRGCDFSYSSSYHCQCSVLVDEIDDWFVSSPWSLQLYSPHLAPSLAYGLNTWGEKKRIWVSHDWYNVKDIELLTDGRWLAEAPNMINRWLYYDAADDQQDISASADWNDSQSTDLVLTNFASAQIGSRTMRYQRVGRWERIS